MSRIKPSDNVIGTTKHKPDIIKLTTLIKVWDELKQAQEPLGFCDLERALEARGVVIDNDTEKEANR